MFDGQNVASIVKRMCSDGPALCFRCRRWGRNCRVCRRRNTSSSCNLKKSFTKRRSDGGRSKGVWESFRVDLPVRDDLQWLICIYLHCSSIFILFICSNRQWYYNTDFSQLSIQYSSALHRTAPAQLARWVLWHFHLFHGFRGWKGFKEWYHLIKIII